MSIEQSPSLVVSIVLTQGRIGNERYVPIQAGIRVNPAAGSPRKIVMDGRVADGSRAIGCINAAPFEAGKVVLDRGRLDCQPARRQHGFLHQRLYCHR